MKKYIGLLVCMVSTLAGFSQKNPLALVGKSTAENALTRQVVSAAIEKTVVSSALTYSFVPAGQPMQAVPGLKEDEPFSSVAFAQPGQQAFNVSVPSLQFTPGTLQASVKQDVSHQLFTEPFLVRPRVSQAGAPNQGALKFVQLKHPITLTTLWGEKQHLSQGSYLNVTDPANIYGMDGAAFERTYQALSSVATQPAVVSQAPQAVGWQRITQAQAVRADESYAHAVFTLKDASGTVQAYLKKGSLAEVNRMKLFASLLEGSKLYPGGLRARFSHLEIEYPRVLEGSLADLPPAVQEQVQSQLTALRNIRSPHQRLQTFFLMSAADTSGMCWMDIKMLNMKSYVQRMGLEDDLLNTLHGNLDQQPVTGQEWAEVKELVSRLRGAGFSHGDFGNNLFIKRNPQTHKLRLTLIDFEPDASAFTDEEILSNWERLLRENDYFLP